MKTLPKGEAANLVMTVKDDNTVNLSHTVQVSKNDPRVQIENWVLDFTGVSHHKLLLLATRTIKIILQRDWRISPDRMKADKWDNRTFNVLDIISNMGKRSTKDPMAAAKNAIGKLSDAEFTELMENLGLNK